MTSSAAASPEVPSPARWQALLVFAVLAAVVTLALQAWVGTATIYAPGLEDKRSQFHQAILTNTPPDKGWAAVGAASLNIRVAVVYAAEAVHQAAGLSVARAYWLIDTVFLFLILASLPLYLRRWLPDTWCLVGLLYLAAVLPLTYFLHAYQPWDRMSVFAWLVLLALVRDQRVAWAAVVLALSITIKFDTILIAALYALAFLQRRDWARQVLACLLLAVVGYATLALLKHLLPAPAEPARFSWAVATFQLRLNVQDLLQHHLRHPVLLALGPLAALALVGLRRRERFLVAGVAFGGLLFAVWFVFTVYAEVRAQLPLLLLLLPPALMTLRDWFEPARPPAGPGAAS
jgi:hypothetical protein